MDTNLPLEAFTRACAAVIEDAWDRMTAEDRVRCNEGMLNGAITGFSLRVDLSLQPGVAPTIVFDMIARDGSRRTVQTSRGTYPAAH